MNNYRILKSFPVKYNVYRCNTWNWYWETRYYVVKMEERQYQTGSRLFFGVTEKGKSFQASVRDFEIRYNEYLKACRSDNYLDKGVI